MTGKVIPERIFNRTDYFNGIFEPINTAIRPFDTENILDHHFLNSRGAIARFDRNAIEIRVIDIQECPKADVAIAALIIEVLKLLVGEELIALEDQKSWHENVLFEIFDRVIRDAETTVISDIPYLNIFDLHKESSVNQIWRKLYDRTKDKISGKHRETIELILENGTLSTRIMKVLGEDPSEESILKTYRKLGDCLNNNQLFVP